MNAALRQTRLLLIFCCAPAFASGIGLDDLTVPHQAMVRVASYVTDSEFLAQYTARWGGVAIRSICSRKTYLLSIPSNVTDSQVLNDLSTLVNPNPSNPDPNKPLVWSSANFQSETGEGRTGTIYVKTPPPGAGGMRNQYAVPLMGLTQSRANAQAILVAVLDTGVDATHEALTGSVLSGYNEINQNSDTSDSSPGVDTDGDGLIDEMAGHGTFLAGLIVMSAPKCKILPVKVLDSNGRGDLFTIAQGIYYAIDRGAKVLNLSLSSTHDAPVMRDACNEAVNDGLLVVAAAGNSNSSSPEFPAGYSNVISVAATDAQDVKASYSNYGPTVTLSAPGDSVMDASSGTYDLEQSILGPIPGNQYAVWEGTSMSTAFVSGALALLRSQHPEWPQTSDVLPTALAVLTGTTANIDAQNPNYVSKLGSGRLGVLDLVNAGPNQLPLGDLNGDHSVNWTDLAVQLSMTGVVHSSADLDCNGHVDFNDIAILLSHYGTISDP